MAVSPYHPVDAGSTAESLTHSLMERAVVHGSARLGGEAPVHWAAHVEVPVLSDEDIRFQIHLPGLEQQDLFFRILRQPARNNGTCRARADNDIVVARLEICLTGGLVGCNGQELVGDCGGLGYLNAKRDCPLKKC